MVRGGVIEYTGRGGCAPLEVAVLLAWIVVHFVQILAALAAALFLLLGVLRYLRARAGFQSKPWCLRCRYPCHDLPERRCPECGRPVARRLDPAHWLRWDASTQLLVLLALIAIFTPLRSFRIERLYYMLPDQTLAVIQAREGPLAAPLLPEYSRRLGGQRGSEVAELAIGSWIRHRHAASPVVCVQPLDEGRTVRLGFRCLPQPPRAVESAMRLTRLEVQVVQKGAGTTWLSAEVGDIIVGGHAGGLRRSGMARDIPIEEAPGELEIVMAPVIGKSTRFTDTIGAIEIDGDTGSVASPAQGGATFELRVKRYWVYDAGYAVAVSGSPAVEPGSDAYDVVVPWYHGGQHRMRFLGWEWLSGGVHSFVEGDPHESDIEVIIRR